MTTYLMDPEPGTPFTVPNFIPPTIAELLAGPFNKAGDYYIYKGRPCIVFPDWDYAEDWSTHPISGIHPYAPCLEGREISEGEFRRIVREIHHMDVGAPLDPVCESSMERSAGLIAQLPPGALDIVGDVHGELEALTKLLQHLGYPANGDHPDGRTLVFVGDLGDRGPNSPGVYSLVRRLVDRGRAMCVLGNHELNLLRRERKPGNGWAWSLADDHDQRASSAAIS